MFSRIRERWALRWYRYKYVGKHRLTGPVDPWREVVWSG